MNNIVDSIKLTSAQNRVYKKITNTALAKDFSYFLKTLSKDGYISNGTSSISLNYETKQKVKNISLSGKTFDTGEDFIELINVEAFKKILLNIKETTIKLNPQNEQCFGKLLDDFLKKFLK